MEDTIFIARYVADRLHTADLVAYADEKLSKGQYSDHLLSILDQDPKVWSVISELFEKAVIDLGFTIPTFESAIWVLLRHHIGLISSGNVSPTKQFRLLLQDIERFDLHKGITEYVGDTIGISFMYGWYHSDGSNLVEIDSGIFSESKKWVQEYGIKH